MRTPSDPKCGFTSASYRATSPRPTGRTVNSSQPVLLNKSMISANVVPGRRVMLRRKRPGCSAQPRLAMARLNSSDGRITAAAREGSGW
jgi:hypothetical protein